MSIAAIVILTNSLSAVPLALLHWQLTPQYRRYTGQYCDQNRRDFYVNTETETAVQIFYRNFRNVSNKQTELYNVCYVEFQIDSLTEIELKDIFSISDYL